MIEQPSLSERLAAIEALVRAQPAQMSVEDYDPVLDEAILTAIAELIEESAAQMKQRLNDSIAYSAARSKEIELLQAARW